MNHNDVAMCLAELGNTHRLSIFRYLVKAGKEGAIVGEIQSVLQMPGSTLNHHLTRMANVGLIKQEKDGRMVKCIPVYAKLDMIITFLQDECCVGHILV
mgnify:CR=1 FL=1